MQDFLSIRLASHGLDHFRFPDVESLIAHYGCIQAQDIGQAQWMIGSRIEGSTEAMIR